MKYSYNEVIHIIENTRRFGKLTGYDVSKRMLEQLGNPQSGIPFVHVAGTNGKGSTTAFLCKILEQTGKRVGMFTSPHLITFEERIRINGAYISKEDVTRLGNQLLEMEFDVPPTMFDYCLAMAVLYFKEQQCDIMVMETGIGGRYDSTNALGIPELAVITKIGFDHTAILGDTLEAIAGEKAGIIKYGCPVVISDQQPEITKVLVDYFKQVNHLSLEFDPIRAVQARKERFDIVNAFKIQGFFKVGEEDLQFVRKIPMKMQGGYQIENAATAALAARVLLYNWQRQTSALYEEEFNEIETYIKNGISQAFWKGRMEIINQDPFFMIDGAHNPHGVSALAESLQKLYPNEKFHFIMAVMADKDYEEMIDVLLPLAIDFITVTPESNRALQSKDLAECIARKGIKAHYAEHMEDVIRPLLPKQKEMDGLWKEDVSQAHCLDKQSEENCKDVDIFEQSEQNPYAYLLESRYKIIAFGSLYFIGAIEAMLEEVCEIETELSH